MNSVIEHPFVTKCLHKNGLAYLNIETPLCNAKIFLQGAQITHFHPQGQKPLLWVSSADDYQPGNGIRGGVPICWPWFGQHTKSEFPQHGFARTSIWSFVSSNVVNDIVVLRLSLNIDEQNRHYWPHNTKLEIEFILSDTLEINLINTNLSDETIELTQALHSYFPIENIHELTAIGFSGSKYIEFGKGPYPQTGNDISFKKETDRVYTDLTSAQYLQTRDGVIEVKRNNSKSAVLWNPWIQKSQRLSRFNDDDYLSMICLEAANVLEDKVSLERGQSHILSTYIRWQ